MNYYLLRLKLQTRMNIVKTITIYNLVYLFTNKNSNFIIYYECTNLI